MTPAITLWLAIVLASGVICWTANNKRQAIAFALVAILAAPATLLPLGYATPLSPPKGHYTVLGARIDVDKAIYVLLDTEGEPRYYRLPYTTGTANNLQNALDGADGNNGTVSMEQGETGSPGFAEEGAGGRDEPKRAEAPAIIGGVE